MRDVESSLRRILRGFGLKVGAISKGKVEARIRELVAGQAMLERVAKPLLRARTALRAEYATLHRELLMTVREDEVCAQLMTVPGVGAVVAVTFGSAMDQPGRFAKSKAVGAHFGLTPKKYPSGEIDRTGRISKVGDAMVHSTVRGGQRDVDPRRALLGAQGLGAAGRQPARHEKMVPPPRAQSPEHGGLWCSRWRGNRM